MKIRAPLKKKNKSGFQSKKKIYSISKQKKRLTFFGVRDNTWSWNAVASKEECYLDAITWSRTLSGRS